MRDVAVRRARYAGFTITEMMVVVAIVAVIVAVGVPVLTRYMRRAKTAEAQQSLNQLAAGAKSYFEAAHTDLSGRPLARQFPASTGAGGYTPQNPCCGSTCAAGGQCTEDPSAGCDEWDGGPYAFSWHALRFKIAAGHYYQYSFASAGTGTDATFTASAKGNLDCDTLSATWQVTGDVDGASLRPRSGQPFVVGGSNNELE